MTRAVNAQALAAHESSLRRCIVLVADAMPLWFGRESQVAADLIALHRALELVLATAVPPPPVPALLKRFKLVRVKTDQTSLARSVLASSAVPALALALGGAAHDARGECGRVRATLARHCGERAQRVKEVAEQGVRIQLLLLPRAPTHDAMQAARSELLRDARVARGEADAYMRLAHLAAVYTERAVPQAHDVALRTIAALRDMALEDDEACLYYFPPTNAAPPNTYAKGRLSRWMLAVGDALAVLDESDEEKAAHYADIFHEQYCELVPHTAAFERPGNRAKRTAARRHVMRSVYEATRAWPTE